MPEYLTIEQARTAPGLRLIGLRGVPSPWTEAARGIFYVKGLECRYAARGDAEPQDAIARWTGDSSVPVVAWEREPLRTGWADILLLAERLAPDPALLPAAQDQRVDVLGLGHEICGQMGLGWCVRLLMVDRSIQAEKGGFPEPVAAMLAAKYGYTPGCADQARRRAKAILADLDQRLAAQPYLVGATITAADIYWATFANLLTPLPEHELPALPLIRQVYSGCDADVLGAVTERLRLHQRNVYERHLELPVPL